MPRQPQQRHLCPFGTSDALEEEVARLGGVDNRFLPKRSSFTNAEGAENYRWSRALAEKNRRVGRVARAPFRTVDPTRLPPETPRGSLPYTPHTLRRSYVATKEIYLANLEKSAARRDPITRRAGAALRRAGGARRTSPGRVSGANRT